MALKGDVDQSGVVDLADAILALKIAAGIDIGGAFLPITGDSNADGKIGLAEILYILRESSDLN